MSGSHARSSYLIECYWPAVSAEQVAAAVLRVREETSKLRRRGGDVEFVGSILVPADETVFCLFDGCEADVRTVSEWAQVPFERVLASPRIGGKQAKDER